MKRSTFEKSGRAVLQAKGGVASLIHRCFVSRTAAAEARDAYSGIKKRVRETIESENVDAVVTKYRGTEIVAYLTEASQSTSIDRVLLLEALAKQGLNDVAIEGILAQCTKTVSRSAGFRIEELV